MARLLTCLFLISVLVIPMASGCAALPAPRERIVTFNVTGFTVPVPLAYSGVAGVTVKYPAMSTTIQQAVIRINSLILEAATEVLEERGRQFGLFADVMTQVLQQINVQISYLPLECSTAFP